MTRIIKLCKFIDDSPSQPAVEIGVDASENQRRQGRIVAFPFRSSNDQQQVYALRTFYADGGGNFSFIDFND